MLRARKFSAIHEAQQIPCDVCSSDEASASETVKPASMYCVQCQQNYCEQCSLHHSKVKRRSSHTQVDIGTGSKPAKISKLSTNKCEEHKDKKMEAFCRDCNVPVCVMCLFESHQTHDVVDIKIASEDFRKRGQRDAHKVSNHWTRSEEVLQRLEKEKTDVIKHLAGIENEINTAADKSIAAIQRDKVKLLSEVKSIKRKRVEQLETVKQEVEQHMTGLGSYTRESETLLSSRTACDVTRSANSLHDRAVELVKFDIIGHVDSSLSSLLPVNVTFTSSTVLDKEDRNLVGTITEEGQLKQFFSSNISK